jgi:hypothetical protein
LEESIEQMITMSFEESNKNNAFHAQRRAWSTLTIIDAHILTSGDNVLYNSLNSLGIPVIGVASIAQQ